MVYVLTDEERLNLCIKTLDEIKQSHSAEIILNGCVVRDKAYIQSKNCLDRIMEEVKEESGT